MQETKATKEYWAAVQAAREGMDSLDIAAQNTSIVPLIGDALGVASDVKQYIKGEKELTPINAVLSAVGALPFVPSPSQVKKIIGRPQPESAKRYEELENIVTQGSKEYILKVDEMAALERETGVWRGADGQLRTNYLPEGLELNMSYQYANVRPAQVTPQGKFIQPATGTRALISNNPRDPVAANSMVDVMDQGADQVRAMTVGDFVSNLPQMDGVNLADIKTYYVTPDGKVTGSFYPGAGTIGIADNQSRDETLRTVLHELNHVVQRAQGLHGGANVDMFLPDNATLEQTRRARNDYRRVLGEIDAETAAYYDTFPKEVRDKVTMSDWQNDYVRQILERDGIILPDNYPAQIMAAIKLPQK